MWFVVHNCQACLDERARSLARLYLQPPQNFTYLVVVSLDTRAMSCHSEHNQVKDPSGDIAQDPISSGTYRSWMLSRSPQLKPSESWKHGLNDTRWILRGVGLVD